MFAHMHIKGRYIYWYTTCGVYIYGPVQVKCKQTSHDCFFSLRYTICVHNSTSEGFDSLYKCSLCGNLSIYLSFICLFICLCVCLFICLSVCLCVCLFICLLSVYLSVFYLSFYLSFFCLCVCLFICLCVCVSVFLSVRPSLSVCVSVFYLSTDPSQTPTYAGTILQRFPVTDRKTTPLPRGIEIVRFSFNVTCNIDLLTFLQ